MSAESQTRVPLNTQTATEVSKTMGDIRQDSMKSNEDMWVSRHAGKILAPTLF